jgi:hypothetical protein
VKELSLFTEEDRNAAKDIAKEQKRAADGAKRNIEQLETAL